MRRWAELAYVIVWYVLLFTCFVIVIAGAIRDIELRSREFERMKVEAES